MNPLATRLAGSVKDSMRSGRKQGEHALAYGPLIPRTVTVARSRIFHSQSEEVLPGDVRFFRQLDSRRSQASRSRKTSAGTVPRARHQLDHVL